MEDARKDAEMIVLYLDPGGTPAFDELDDLCYAPTEAPASLPKQPTAADFAPYEQRLRAIYDRIFMLRGGMPVIIRAVDAYMPVLDFWRKAGVDAFCTKMWETWTGVARDVPASYEVPMVSMYDAFNGPGHDLDPTDKGYIAHDGMHPSDTGRAPQVDVIDAAGYEPVTR